MYTLTKKEYLEIIYKGKNSEQLKFAIIIPELMVLKCLLVTINYILLTYYNKEPVKNFSHLYVIYFINLENNYIML